MNKIVYEVYLSKSILNVHKHVNGGWFWDKYTAFPYKGCEWGCEYCYSREEKYQPHKNTKDLQTLKLSDPFSQYIKVKKDSPKILARQLKNKLKDLIYLDNYQPIENKYRYARKMLEVCLKLGFPVFVNEKSPVLLQDLDILQKIAKKTYLNVGWSIITTKDDNIRLAFEPKAPPVKNRFEAMKKLASKGIYTGIVFMPILPFIYDTEENIRNVIKKTKECGGRYVLDGGLSLWGYCGKHFYKVLAKYDSNLVKKYKELYRTETSQALYYAKVHKLVLKYCKKHKLDAFISRPISSYPKDLQINKKIAANFYFKARELSLSGQRGFKEWAYRKAAWALDDLEKSIDEIYKNEGIKGITNIKGVGKSIAAQIEQFIK